MTTKYITQLPNLPAASIAAGDAFEIEDISVAQGKHVTAADLQTYITSGGAFFIGQCGRLTTETGVPESTSDRTAQTSIYWTPYLGTWLKLYNGSAMTLRNETADLTLTLNASAHLSGSIYDVFYFYDSGGPAYRLGTGPAWSSGTARGSGAGTTELELFQGALVNKNSITLKNGAASYAGIAARQASFLGAFYATANGQTTDSLSRRLLVNYYNKVPRTIYTSLNGSHTYTTTSWQAWNSNTTIGQARADFLVAYPHHYILQAAYMACKYTAVASALDYVGIGINATTSNSMGYDISLGVNGTNISTATGTSNFSPTLGYNYMQGVEKGSATSHTLTDMVMSATLWC